MEGKADTNHAASQEAFEPLTRKSSRRFGESGKNLGVSFKVNDDDVEANRHETTGVGRKGVNTLRIRDIPQEDSAQLELEQNYEKLCAKTLRIRAIPLGQINFGLFIAFFGSMLSGISLSDSKVVDETEESKIWILVCFCAVIVLIGLAIVFAAEVRQIELVIKQNEFTISKFKAGTLGFRTEVVQQRNMSEVVRVEIVPVSTPDKSGCYYILFLHLDTGEQLQALECSSASVARTRKLRLVKWLRIAADLMSPKRQGTSSRASSETSMKDKPTEFST